MPHQLKSKTSIIQIHCSNIQQKCVQKERKVRKFGTEDLSLLIVYPDLRHIFFSVKATLTRVFCSKY
jgi:hypothetical protein